MATTSREEDELNHRYPEGSLEREVLDYSRGSHERDNKIPPLLKGAFAVLLGITTLMAIVAVVGYIYH